MVCVLRQPADEYCPDDETCFQLGHVRERPGLLQAIARTVTDPHLIKHYAEYVGPEEVLVEFTRLDIGDTRRTVGTVPGAPDRVLIVARSVSDHALIAAYKHKIGPGELLVEFDESDVKEAVPA
jgi:hypothetical protein